MGGEGRSWKTIVESSYFNLRQYIRRKLSTIFIQGTVVLSNIIRFGRRGTNVVEIACKVGYIDQATFQRLDNEVIEIRKMLVAMIKRLRQEIADKKSA